MSYRCAKPHKNTGDISSNPLDNTVLKPKSQSTEEGIQQERYLAIDAERGALLVDLAGGPLLDGKVLDVDVTLFTC